MAKQSEITCQIYPGVGYPNEALTDVCKLLLDEYGLTPEQVANLAADIPPECEGISDSRAEQAWEDYQNREQDDSAYRRDMIAAGRGHLLR